MLRVRSAINVAKLGKAADHNCCPLPHVAPKDQPCVCSTRSHSGDGCCLFELAASMIVRTPLACTRRGLRKTRSDVHKRCERHTETQVITSDYKWLFVSFTSHAVKLCAPSMLLLDQTSWSFFGGLNVHTHTTNLRAGSAWKLILRNSDSCRLPIARQLPASCHMAIIPTCTIRFGNWVEGCAVATYIHAVAQTQNPDPNHQPAPGCQHMSAYERECQGPSGPLCSWYELIQNISCKIWVGLGASTATAVGVPTAKPKHTPPKKTISLPLTHHHTPPLFLSSYLCKACHVNVQLHDNGIWYHVAPYGENVSSFSMSASHV